MSNREKGAWVELLALLLIWGFYFTSLIGAAASGALEAEGFASAMGVRFVACAVLSILVGVGSGVLGEILARRSRAPVREEAEAWAGLRATRVAHGVLIVLLLALTVVALLFGAFAGETMAGRANALAAGLLSNGLVLVANGALAALVLAELVHYAALIFFLRRDR